MQAAFVQSAIAFRLGADLALCLPVCLLQGTDKSILVNTGQPLRPDRGVACDEEEISELGEEILGLDKEILDSDNFVQT